MSAQAARDRKKDYIANLQEEMKRLIKQVWRNYYQYDYPQYNVSMVALKLPTGWILVINSSHV